MLLKIASMLLKIALLTFCIIVNINGIDASTIETGTTTESSFWSLVVSTPIADSEIQSRVETASISEAEPNMSDGTQDENISFITTTDNLFVPSENISDNVSALQADYSTAINNDTMSNQSLIADLDKTQNHTISMIFPHNFDEKSTHLVELISAITPERNFTEENNYLTLTNSQENNFARELSTKDSKEINSSHPTISDSSATYVGENVESHSVETTTPDNTTIYLVNVNGKNTFVENSTIDISPPGLDKLPTNTSIQINVPPPSKKKPKHIYKLILSRDCSSDILSSHSNQLLTDILNKRLNAQDSTILVKCAIVYEFTSNIGSRESFSDVIHTIQEIYPDVDVSIANPTSIDYDISCNPRDDSHHFVIPKLAVYISAGTTIGIIVFMIFVVCLRKRCKKKSSSLKLSEMPHVAISVDDYKVTPIPRPSISFPEANRDFLYAYSNETYNRTPGDFLKNRNFSNGVGKEAPKMQKGNSMTLEMQDFNRKGDVGRNRHDSKPTPDYEYASAGYWDRLKGRGTGKKQSLDMKW